MDLAAVKYQCRPKTQGEELQVQGDSWSMQKGVTTNILCDRETRQEFQGEPPFSTEEVQKAVKATKSRKTPGADDMNDLVIANTVFQRVNTRRATGGFHQMEEP